MKIKNLKINGKVFLAPMAGVTNLAYRRLAKRFGAAVVYSEMISDKGIFYNDKKTKDMALIDKNEHPCGIQIFGGDIDTLVNAAKYVDTNTDADIIDINMGCPVTKVLKARSGSDYLKDPTRIYNTVKKVCESVNKPVTVKIRIGWNNSTINVFEVVDNIIKAGAHAITIHGRTKDDMYSNNVRYDLIKKVKELHPDFPIIANGDIKDAKTAKEVLDYTKADAIMIGRGSFGNPYIFTQINEYIENGVLLPDLSIDKKLDLLVEYARDLCDLKGEFIAFKELRSQAPWYIKGVNNSAFYRNKLAQINTMDDLLLIVNEIKKTNS